jgi:adenylosuccinate synthase
MQEGKFNILLDQAWGSSGKGLFSAYLADKYNIKHVSSANAPNAGHSHVDESGQKFIAKAIPTAAALRKFKGVDINCYLSPGSYFFWKQLVKEWVETNKPKIFIHSRAGIVTEEHARREREGAESTKHVASTMQGSGTAIADKILRKPNVELAGTHGITKSVESFLIEGTNKFIDELTEKIQIIDGMEFRNLTHSIINEGYTWLHEGSQGYALSLDHGSHFPECTSRNCTSQAAMDYMAVPPKMVGDIYMNIRSFPIRVGNVYEDGVQKGYSGDFYPDVKELTWEEIGTKAGMPPDEIEEVKKREFTTVTGRLRRTCEFSFLGLKDAVKVNGATKLIVNFIQYINWNDRNLGGGKETFEKLSNESRKFIDRIEDEANVPVIYVGTGPKSSNVIDRS